MTTGSPPSMTATQEFVVPRSMPITLAMKHHDEPDVGARVNESEGSPASYFCSPPVGGSVGAALAACESATVALGLATTTAAGRTRRSCSLYPRAISEITV